MGGLVPHRCSQKMAGGREFVYVFVSFSVPVMEAGGFKMPFKSCF